MTTQDMTASRIRTADEHHIRVYVEMVKLLQANIVEPKIQYFPSDLHAARFDPTVSEHLPKAYDAIRIVNQIVHQESKYSLYDFDVGPPHTIEEYSSSRVPEWGDCMDILVYSVLSHCKSVSHEYRNVEFPELSLISESDSQTCVEPVREASVATCHA